VTPLVLLFILAQAPGSSRVQVDWVMPEACPDPTELTSTLAEALPKERTFTASVRVDEPRSPEGRWRAVVTTTSRDGQTRLRAVDAPDCARVTEAALLVMTLAATAVPPEPVDESRPAVLPPAPPSTPPDETPAPPLPDDGPSGAPLRLRLGLRVQGLFGTTLGVLPGPGFSTGVGVAFAFGRLRVEAAVFQWLDSQTQERRGARFSVTSIRGRAGWLFEPGEKWFLGPFAGAEVAFVQAIGTGITLPLPSTTRVVTALAGATVSRELSPTFRVFASLELGVNLQRPVFVLDLPSGEVDVHRVGLAVGRLTIGLELHLP
jgi:hypothetical protein